MLNIKQKIAAATASAVILSSVLTSGAFAANNNTVKIKGNGAGSKNTASIKNKHTTNVTQSNGTAVVNLVGVFQNTGGNNANNNGGKGDVTVGSGDATSTVTNITTTHGNTASVNPCGCDQEPNHIVVSDNLAGSKNDASIVNNSSTDVTQTNRTLVVNGVLVAQNTGGNNANDNGGNGDVKVGSGDATSTVTNTTTTGGNTL